MGCNGCELWNAKERTCYAGTMTEKWKGKKGYPDSFLQPKLFPGRMLEAANWSDLSGLPRRDSPWLDGLPRIIFVSDMGDSLSNVPGHEISFEYLKAEIIGNVSGFSGCRHLWIWLTKRPGRMAQFDQWLHARDILWPDNLIAATSIITACTAPQRINSLKKLRAKYKALSVEPLWESVDLDLVGIDWIMVGGESTQAQGAKIRPFDLNWARALRDQCKKTGTAFFFKQAGSNPVEGDRAVSLKDSHGGNWDEFPEDLRIREIPSAFKTSP